MDQNFVQSIELFDFCKVYLNYYIKNELDFYHFFLLQLGGSTIVIWCCVLMFGNLTKELDFSDFYLLLIGGAILVIIAPLFGCLILSCKSSTVVLPIYIVLMIGCSVLFTIGTRNSRVLMHAIGVVVTAWITNILMVNT